MSKDERSEGFPLIPLDPSFIEFLRIHEETRRAILEGGRVEPGIMGENGRCSCCGAKVATPEAECPCCGGAGPNSG